MQQKRSLKDIFNRKGFRKLTLAFVGATVLFGSLPVRAQTVPGALPAASCQQTAAQPAPIPYEEQLFRQNDNQPLSQTLQKMTSEERMQYYLQKFCFDINDAAKDKKPGDQALIAALDQLRHLNYMGKPLIDLASQSHLKFCQLKHMATGVGAQYLPPHDFVAAGNDESKQGEVLDLAHEILHASQSRLGLLTYYYNWDMDSRIRMKLGIEAAPIAMEFAVAYEKKLDGDPSYWNYLKKHDAVTAYTDPENHRLFDETYQASVKEGMKRGPALRAAAHAVFERVFESADWRDFYLNMELNEYIGDLNSGSLAKYGDIQHNQFGQDAVDKTGKVGLQQSFTAGAHMPEVRSLLAKNQKMQWAFEAVDLARHRAALGVDAPEVKALEQAAAADKNPYLKIDLAELGRRLDTAVWAENYKYTYEIMDKMLTEPGCAPKAAVPTAQATPPAPRA
jgi:hypothetical protein